MHTKACTLLVSVLALAASSLALADTVVNVKSETVRYDDVRLSSKVGVAVLYGRLRTAAERACSSLEGRELSRKSRYRACYDEALAKAVAAVNHPGLTEYYHAKKGTTPPSPPMQSVTVVAESR